MYALCLFLSVFAAAIGVFAIGWGIPNHDFSVGSTAIIAGATRVAAGIVMFGLAAAVRQLRRIADALPRAAPAARRQPTPEGVEGALVQRQAPVQAPVQAPAQPPSPVPAQRIPYPPRPAPDQREVRFEQRPPAPPPPEVPEPPAPRERPRPNILGVARAAGEAPMVEAHEEVPLAPSRVPAAQMGRGAPPRLPTMAHPPPP